MEKSLGSDRTFRTARYALQILLVGAGIGLASAAPGEPVASSAESAGTSSEIPPDHNQLRRELKYVAATDFMQMAQEVLVRHLSAQGDAVVAHPSDEQPEFEAVLVGETLIIATPRTNTLAVSGVADHLRVINDLADEVDVRPQSVCISAIFAQVELGDDLEFGMDILRGLDGAIDVGGTPFDIGEIARTASNGAAILDVPEPVDPAQTGQLQAISQALVEAGQGQLTVISRPIVFASNQKQAVISISTDPGSSHEFQVTPLINSDDEVTLEIGNRITRQLPDDTESVQELATTVRVGDNDVVVLGGIVSEAGDSRQELLVLVQPTIIPGASDTGEFQAWASENLQDGLHGFNSDANGDGVSNGVEYVFGETEIRSPAPGHVTAPPASIPNDITLTLEASGDLKNWTEILRFESGQLAFQADGVRIDQGMVVDDRDHGSAADAIYYRYRANLRSGGE